MATTAYDDVGYPGGVFVQTHPARLAAIARLHGVPAASPAECRVLEIGTADGGNLLPLALTYPRSEFVGCDLAGSAVARGLADRDALGARNLTLLTADLCTLPDSLGPFDYVIAHGVFSWVPEPVRDGLLALCRRTLAPHGVAYLSYNALPGGYVSQMLADMMKYHVRRMPDPSEQIGQARMLMKVVADGTNVPGPMGEMYKAEARKVIDTFGDAVLYHDDLAAVTRRYYFHEVATLADRHGLRFLGEADYHEMTNLAFPPVAAAVLDNFAKNDRIQEEQYRDFLCLRRFRQTLFVKNEVEVERPARTAEVATFHVFAPPLTPERPDPDYTPGVNVAFDTAKGSRVTLDHPLAKAVLYALAEAPNRPVPVADVIAAAARRVGTDPVDVSAEARNAVLAMLFQAFQVGLVHLAVDPPIFPRRAGPKPRLWPLARHKLEAGSKTVPTLRHNMVDLETPVTRQLVLACDGTRDRDAILDRVTDWAASQPPVDGQPARTRDEIRAGFAADLEGGLQKAADLGLLVE